MFASRLVRDATLHGDVRTVEYWSLYTCINGRSPCRGVFCVQGTVTVEKMYRLYVLWNAVMCTWVNWNVCVDVECWCWHILTCMLNLLTISISRVQYCNTLLVYAFSRLFLVLAPHPYCQKERQQTIKKLQWVLLLVEFVGVDVVDSMAQRANPYVSGINHAE